MSRQLSEPTHERIALGTGHDRPSKALSIEWLGQTAASLLWIGSVLMYGISSGGDVLQLLAASSWLVANIAALATVEAS